MICNRDVKGYKFVFVGVEFLAFDVLFHNISEQKMIGKWFCAPILYRKYFFLIRNKQFVTDFWCIIKSFWYKKNIILYMYNTYCSLTYHLCINKCYLLLSYGEKSNYSSQYVFFYIYFPPSIIMKRIWYLVWKIKLMLIQG